MITLFGILVAVNSMEGIYHIAHRKNVRAIGDFLLAGTILAVILVG